MNLNLSTDFLVLFTINLQLAGFRNAATQRTFTMNVDGHHDHALSSDRECAHMVNI